MIKGSHHYFNFILHKAIVVSIDWKRLIETDPYNNYSVIVESDFGTVTCCRVWE